jgi:hypothetical protein
MDSKIDEDGTNPAGEITGISTSKCLDIVRVYIKNM